MKSDPFLRVTLAYLGMYLGGVIIVILYLYNFISIASCFYYLVISLEVFIAFWLSGTEILTRLRLTRRRLGASLFWGTLGGLLLQLQHLGTFSALFDRILERPDLVMYDLWTNIVPQEIFFRAFLQTEMIIRFGKVNGVLVAAYLFTMIHVPGLVYDGISKGMDNPLWIFRDLYLWWMAGLIYGWLLEHTQNLWAPITSHGLATMIFRAAEEW